MSLMLLTRIGWAGRHWALPFLTALVVSARYDRRKGRRHKTFTDYAQQMLVCLRRWLPERDLVVVADGGYAKREFLRHCQSMSKPMVVVTKLRTGKRTDGAGRVHRLQAFQFDGEIVGRAHCRPNALRPKAVKDAECKSIRRKPCCRRHGLCGGALLTRWVSSAPGGGGASAGAAGLVGHPATSVGRKRDSRGIWLPRWPT